MTCLEITIIIITVLVLIVAIAVIAPKAIQCLKNGDFGIGDGKSHAIAPVAAVNQSDNFQSDYKAGG